MCFLHRHNISHGIVCQVKNVCHLRVTKKPTKAVRLSFCPSSPSLGAAGSGRVATEREERANKEAAIRRNCTKCTPSARRGEQRGSAARPGTERGAVGNFFTALGSYGTRWPARRAARRWKTAKGENKDPPINRRGETPTGGQNSPGG